MQINRRYGYYAAAIIWMAVIFYFSSLPDLKSSLPNVWDLVLRKMVHAFEFGLLYMLWWKSLADSKHRWFSAFCIAFAYAVSDEFHQSFVHGRVASPVDVGIDTFGIVIAILLLKYKNNSAKTGGVVNR
jgi:VanZ family protein